MPIWSLTAERLAKLKEAIANKKIEHDELLALSDKDLWCRDLDDLMAEWDSQLALDAEIKTNIRRMGRRVSKKIGAGRSRKAKDDDEYEPDKKTRGRPKAAAKSTAAKPAAAKETKSAQRFAAMFEPKSKVKKETSPEVMELSDFSEDDFAALGRSKPASKPISSQSQSQSEEPDNTRGRRAAASKARTIFDDDSESSDDDKMLGDVGALVKGIGKPKGESVDTTSGRLSLHAMSRPEASQSNGGSSGLPKMKTKSAKSFDFDSPDDTNYELLAQSSPHKTAAKSDHIDSFLSDDDPIPAPVKTSTAKAASLSSAAPKVPAGLATVKKARGRPAGAKTKAEPKTKAASKAVAKPAVKSSVLSPAAKAYAAKKAVKKSVLEDSDEEMEDASSPPPRPAARGRPGRAAAARRPIIIDDEDSSMVMDQQEDESDDPFEVDDDDD